MGGIDWSRVRFTDHMVEAAAVVGECQVAFDFDGQEQACWDVQVCRVLKGGAAAPFFAVAVDRADPAGLRPVGEGDDPEAALEACLAAIGIHHRRRLRQAGD